MPKPKKVEITADHNSVIVDGEVYIFDRVKPKKIDGVMHTDRLIFKKQDKTSYEGDISLIVKTFSEKTNTEEMLRDILRHHSASDIRRIAKRIRQKKVIKKQRGCLGFKVGDSYIGILD